MATVPAERERATVTIRDLQLEDYPACVEISNLLYPENRDSVEGRRFEDEHWDRDKYVRRQFVATDPSGAVVAEAAYFHSPGSFHPQRFAMWIGVHPAWQWKGLGSALYEHLTEEFRARDAIALRTWTQETRTDTAAWLSRRGFKELMRAWESRLDLTTFDVGNFAKYWGPPEGITITSLAAELKSNPNAMRDLFDLDNAVAPDMPRIDPHTPMDFNMFQDWVLKSPGSTPEAIIIAKDGDLYVGLTELYRNTAEEGVMNTGLTGVRREYRGRGVAFAVKLRALDWAKRNGYRQARTFNSTLNAPMLGINVKLGFVKQPVWITFGKDLTW